MKKSLIIVLTLLLIVSCEESVKLQSDHIYPEDVEINFRHGAIQISWHSGNSDYFILYRSINNEPFQMLASHLKAPKYIDPIPLASTVSYAVQGVKSISVSPMVSPDNRFILTNPAGTTEIDSNAKILRFKTQDGGCLQITLYTDKNGGLIIDRANVDWINKPVGVIGDFEITSGTLYSRTKKIQRQRFYEFLKDERVSEEGESLGVDYEELTSIYNNYHIMEIKISSLETKKKTTFEFLPGSRRETTSWTQYIKRLEHTFIVYIRSVRKKYDDFEDGVWMIEPNKALIRYS